MLKVNSTSAKDPVNTVAFTESDVARAEPVGTFPSDAYIFATIVPLGVPACLM